MISLEGYKAITELFKLLIEQKNSSPVFLIGLNSEKHKDLLVKKDKTIVSTMTIKQAKE
jgi:hypothetical protein